MKAHPAAALPLLLWLLSMPGAPAAAQDLASAAGLIGLLTLPQVFGAAPCARFTPRPVSLHGAPGGGTATAEIRVRTNWRFPPEGGCEGLAVDVRRLDGGPAAPLPVLETGPEQPAAIVLQRRGPWLRIALDDGGTAWARLQPPAAFIPVEALLRERPLFLTPPAPATAWARPAGSARALPQAPRGGTGAALSLLAVQRHRGRLWLQLQESAEGACDATPQTPAAAPAAAFWLPLHGPAGRPAVWFHSRGC